jgi:hypothetical protein
MVSACAYENGKTTERDLDLVRRILKDIEKLPPDTTTGSLQYPTEYSQAIVNEHLRLLIEEGFIEGSVVFDREKIAAVRIARLKWKGHDFVTASQNDSLWQKAKTSVIKPTMSFTFDFVLEWLKSEGRKQLGLPS